MSPITGEVILNTGIITMAAAVTAAIISIIFNRLSKKRLNKRLVNEYGKKRKTGITGK